MHNRGCVAAKCVPARRHLIEHGTEGEQICACVQFLAASLLYVTTLPHAGGIWQISTSGGTLPRWRRDGRALFYARPDGHLVMTQVQPGPESLAVGATSEALQTRVMFNTFEGSYDVFPDGQRFILANLREGSLHAPLTLITNWPALLHK